MGAATRIAAAAVWARPLTAPRWVRGAEKETMTARVLKLVATHALCTMHCANRVGHISDLERRQGLECGKRRN